MNLVSEEDHERQQVTEGVGGRLLPGPALSDFDKVPCASVGGSATDEIRSEVEVCLVPRPAFNSGTPAEDALLLWCSGVLSISNFICPEEQLERLSGVVGLDPQPSEMPEVVPMAPDGLVVLAEGCDPFAKDELSLAKRLGVPPE